MIALDRWKCGLSRGGHDAAFWPAAGAPLCHVTRAPARGTYFIGGVAAMLPFLPREGRLVGRVTKSGWIGMEPAVQQRCARGLRATLLAAMVALAGCSAEMPDFSQF